jgi:hypothetical protein
VKDVPPKVRVALRELQTTLAHRVYHINPLLGYCSDRHEVDWELWGIKTIAEA